MVSVMTILVTWATVFTWIEVKKYALKQRVLHYLTEVKGYKTSEIQDIHAHFSMLPTYLVHVVFQDEPEVIYSYWDHGGEKMIQTYQGANRKEREVKNPRHADEQASVD